MLRIVALVVLLVGCGNAHPTKNVPDDSTWQSVLPRFQNATAAFSLSFYGEPPDGTTLRASLHEDSAEAACDLYKAESQSTLPDFWYIGVVLSDTAAGEYGVVPEVAASGAASQSSVRLVRVSDGKKLVSYQASVGSVSLYESPRNFEEWQAGGELSGGVDVGFPMAALHQVECRGEMALGGASAGEPSYECTCSDDAGNLTVCISADGENCCQGTGPTVSLQLDLRASQCPWMCIATNASLYRHCLEMQQ